MADRRGIGLNFKKMGRNGQGQEQGRASPGPRPRPGPARILPDFREDRARQARGISKKQEDRARPGFAVQEDRAPAGLCGF